MANKKQGGTNAIKGILIAVVAVVLVVVMMAAFFFSILDTIIGYIQEIVGKIITAIFNFFKDPFGAMQGMWANFTNNLQNLSLPEWLKWLEKNPGDIKFDPTSYENLRTNPVIVVSDEQAKEVFKKIQDNVNRDVAGLDNLMLKKLLLSYYRGLYLDDTTILVELTRDELGYPCTCNHKICTEDCEIDRDTLKCTKWCDACKEYYSLFKVVKYKTPFFMIGGVTAGYIVAGPLGGLVGGLIGNNIAKESYQYELTNEGVQKLKSSHGTEIAPFDVIDGDPTTLWGYDGTIYLKTTGVVQVFVDGTDVSKCDGCTNEKNRENCKYSLEDEYDEDGKKKVCYYKIKYYSDTTKEGEDYSPFEQLYNHYKDWFEKAETENQKAYTEAVKDYLTLCYTYNNEKNITMYSTRTEIYTEEKWYYGKNKFTLQPEEKKPLIEQNINYQDKISSYANSVEFMIALLETTGSKDFVNAFIQTTVQDNCIQMRLYETKNDEYKYEEVTKTRETSVEGNLEYYAVVTQTKKDGGDWTNVTGDFSIKPNLTYDTVDDSEAKITVSLGKYNEDEEKWEYEIDEDTAYKVVLYKKNANTTKEIETFEFGVFTTKFLWWEWDKIKLEGSTKVGDRSSNTFTDSVTVKEEIMTTTNTLQYNIALTKIKNWWLDETYINTLNKNWYITVIIPKVDENGKEIKDENGNQITTDKTVSIEDIERKNPFEVMFDELPTIYAELENAWISEKDITVKWEKTPEGNQIQTETIGKEEKITDIGSNIDLFDNSDSIQIDENRVDYTLAECLNFQYNKVIHKDDSEKYKEYTINNMSAKDTDVKRRTQFQRYEEVLLEGKGTGGEKPKYNFDTFLGLLKNSTGKFELGAKFTQAGELVEYESLNGGTIKVGPLLENGEAAIVDILGQNNTTSEIQNGEVTQEIVGSNLEELVWAFKYAMNLYTTSDNVNDSGELDYYGPPVTSGGSHITERWENI